MAVQFSAIETNTTDDLFKIKKADAHTFYLCGGVNGSGFIMKSIDAGATWTVAQNNFPGKIFDLDFINSQKMIAVSEMITFYLTGDEWQSWQYIIPPTGEYPLTGYDSEMFSIDMVNDSIGFSCGGKQYQHGVIYRTVDGGITWRYIYKEHEMKNVLMMDATTGYASGYGVIYKTADGGDNWNVTSAENDYFTCMAKSESNHVFAAGYQGSILDIYNSSDNWSNKNKSNKPFEKRIHFNCIDFYNNKTGAAAGVNGIIYITQDGGENWEEGSAFDATQINSIVLTSENSGLAAGAKGKLYKFQF
ncbi:MAG: YCF48-related protein [Bacteroidia bacterium]